MSCCSITFPPFLNLPDSITDTIFLLVSQGQSHTHPWFLLFSLEPVNYTFYWSSCLKFPLSCHCTVHTCAVIPIIPLLDHFNVFLTKQGSWNWQNFDEFVSKFMILETPFQKRLNLYIFIPFFPATLPLMRRKNPLLYGQNIKTVILYWSHTLWVQSRKAKFFY